jgi:hypothetical protein
MFSYRQIMLQAVRIAWKNKYLWFFGLFASLLSIGAEYQILMRAMSRSASLEWVYGWSNFFHSGIFSGRVFMNLGSMFQSDPVATAIALVMMLVVLAAIVLLVWLAVVSQIAIVNNSDKIIKSRKDVAEIGLHQGLRAGSNKFWPVLGLNVLAKILVNVLVLIVSLPLIFVFANRGVAGFVYILLFVLFIPVAISVSFLIKYAIAGVILKKEKFMPAVKNGWSLFRQNWIISLEMAFLLFVISFFSTIVIVLAALILAVPFVILAAAFLALFSAGAFWFMATIGGIVLLVFVIACGSILTTFQTISWTSLYLKLTGKGGESKLERIVPEAVKNIPVTIK